MKQNEWVPLTREEKKELNNALKDVTDAPFNTSALFALFIIFIYPLIWVAVAHFLFHW